jgi:predicted enzyme related to lactoylglutathione lyase
MSVRLLSAVPQFTVPDVVRTAEYYRDVLGFTIEGYWADPPVFAIVERDDVRIHFNHGGAGFVPGGRAPGAYDAYLNVTGVDRLAEDLRARGADIIDGPETRVYGQRELVIRDANGLVLAFGEPTA